MTSFVTVVSRYDPRETVRRLIEAVEARGMAVFARIDHAAAAAAAGLALRPTEVVVFGDPRVGTLLMQADQTLGLDLPLRALVWEDTSGTTHLSYEAPAAIAARHGVGDDAAVVVGKIQATLQAVTCAAAD